MKLSEKQWDSIVKAVAGFGDDFSEAEIVDVGLWIKKAFINKCIADMIMGGELAVKFVNENELKLRAIGKKKSIVFEDKYPDESMDQIKGGARKSQHIRELNLEIDRLLEENRKLKEEPCR